MEKQKTPEIKKEEIDKKEPEKKAPKISEKEKEKTEKRISELKTRLAKCPELISNLPEGQIKEAAKEKYKEAKKLLEEASKDLKNLVLNTIEKIANNLEEQEKKMTQRAEDLQKIGVSEEYAKKYLSDNRCRANEALGLDKMVAFLLEANTLGVNPDDAFNMWRNVWESSMKEDELVGIIKEMKEYGIIDHFYAIYKEVNTKKLNYLKTAIILREINISPEELNRFYGRNSGVDAQELVQVINAMQRQGISKNFYDIYNVSTLIVNPNYQRIASFLEFKKDNKQFNDIVEMYSLKGSTETIKAYMKTFIETYSSKTNENILASAVEAYKTEPSIDKAMSYIAFLESRGIDGLKNFRVLHELLPDIKDIEKIPKADIAALEAIGLDKVSAIILAKEKPKDAIPLEGGPWGVENFAATFSRPNMKDGEIGILYLLSNGDVANAKNMLKANNGYIDEILKGGNNALLFINIMKKIDMDNNAILVIWSARSGIRNNAVKSASNIENFLKYLPTAKSDNTLDLLNAADSYAKFEPTEIKGFLDYVFSRQKSPLLDLKNTLNDSTLPTGIKTLINNATSEYKQIPLKNLATFLEDPTLPLSIEILKTLGTNDREMALQIGRSLYYQGITVLPDKKILELKIKIWEKLQTSVDQEKLWEGTNVVSVHNNEKWLGLKSRFHTEEDEENLRTSIGPNGNLTSFEASRTPTAEELHQLKTDVLHKVETTPPPMRFYFSGHGGPDALYLTHGQIKDGKIDEGQFHGVNHIDSEELATAVAKRSKNFPDQLDWLKTDTYMFSSCMNNQFMRNFYAKIKDQGGIAPRSIGESEYGQNSFTTNPMVADKHASIYGFGKTGTTFGDVRKNERNYKYSNITIYVPNQEGQPQQIAKAEKHKNHLNS